MGIYLRQVCLVAPELAPALDEITRVLGIGRCFVDDGVAKFGLENTLMPVGTNFLEVVAPTEDNTAAGRFLQKRNGKGGYILVCQVDSKDHQQLCRVSAATMDIRVAFESTNGSYHLMQLHPADLNNAMWEIDWDDRNEIEGVWEPAGGIDWLQHVRDDVTVAMTGVELQAENPELTAVQWGKIAGVQPESVPDGYRVPLENGELRFVSDQDGRGPGLAGVDLTVRNKSVLMDNATTIETARGDCIVLCGTRFYLNEVNE